MGTQSAIQSIPAAQTNANMAHALEKLRN
jgi:hypothetical protein